MANVALQQRVVREIAAIESDPAFARAPVMCKLLRFLVVESLAERGDKLKSMTIAIEGLGKSPDFDPQADSYPRVQVARLRKMLEAHYSQPTSQSVMRMAIPVGGYRVDFDSAENLQWPPTQGDASAMPIRAFRRIMPLAAMLAGVAVMLAAGTWLIADTYSAKANWKIGNFPVVLIENFTVLGGGSAENAAAADLRDRLGEMLSRFDCIDVAEAPATDADYRLEGTLRPVPGGTDIRISLIRLSDGKLVWTRARVREPVPDRLFDADDAAELVSSALAQPAGVIHSDQRSLNISINTPYGCWLEFTAFWKAPASVDEKRVRNCVTAWETSNPNSSLASASAAWFHIESARRVSGAARQSLLMMAQKDALRAGEIKPNSAFARYMLMNVALYRGDYSQVRVEADRILALNPQNPQLTALVGLHRIYTGDISGAPILRDALARYYNPPSLFYTGLFLAAVLMDDPVEARRAAKKFLTPERTAQQLTMLAMAEARSGKIAAARRYWREAVVRAPELAGNPGAAFDALPLAPAVRQRSMTWLQPAL